MAFSKIRIRGDIKANWETANPILAEREWGVEWETAIGVGEVNIKIGTGSTAWNDLDYASVKNITKKIVSALAVVSDENPTLNDGDSIDTLFGKIKKKFQYLSDKKLDKSSKYDGVDSTSTDLYATANAVRQVNVKADKNASDITTLNSNLSKKLFVNIGDTSANKHSKIDQIADFYGATWVKNDYNSTFGGGWCFIDSTVVDPYGPYAVQRIMSCENAAILATRYCTKGTWGAWNVGVTKSDLAWNPVSISELNTNAEIPDGGLNNGGNIYVSCGRLHILSLSLNLSSDINGNLFKVGTGHIPVRSARIICTAKSGNVTAMPYLNSNGYVITAGTIPAGQVKLLGIYMTA